MRKIHSTLPDEEQAHVMIRCVSIQSMLTAGRVKASCLDGWSSCLFQDHDKCVTESRLCLPMGDKSCAQEADLSKMCQLDQAL